MTPPCPRTTKGARCPGVGEPLPNIYVARSYRCGVCGLVFVSLAGRK